MTEAKQLDLFDLPKTNRGTTLKLRTFRYPVWSENKARLISRYLYYFIIVTKHGIYIDGFAGPQSSDHPDTWAARAVLDIEPRWLRRFFLCEENTRKVEALGALRAEHPSPDKIEVYSGDFNDVVYDILQSGRIHERVATFCLLDQHTFECEWRTVEALARYKEKAEHKIEQFYFVPTGWLGRALSGTRDFSKVERWWGRPDWQTLKGIPRHEQAERFRRRFLDDLGYAFAYAFPIYDRSGPQGERTMYYMIHATDHPEAPNLMARAYRQATGAKEPPEQFKLEFEEWRASRS
jgi:three-Cys-motif partner protein